jgi:hypothetical protein
MTNKIISDYKKCALLWSHVANEPGGTCRTCCIAKNRIQDSDGIDMTLSTHTMSEILSSQYVENIRQEIREGNEPENCETCWID